MKTKVSPSDLDALIERYDGKHADILDRIVGDYPASRSLLILLVSLAESGDPLSQVAATALLKRYQAGGAALSASLGQRLLDLLLSTKHWESRLHLLQMLPGLSIPKS